MAAKQDAKPPSMFEMAKNHYLNIKAFKEVTVLTCAILSSGSSQRNSGVFKRSCSVPRGAHSNTRHTSSLDQHAPTKFTMFGCRKAAVMTISPLKARKFSSVTDFIVLTATGCFRHVPLKTSPKEPAPICNKLDGAFYKKRRKSLFWKPQLSTFALMITSFGLRSTCRRSSSIVFSLLCLT